MIIQNHGKRLFSQLSEITKSSSCRPSTDKGDLNNISTIILKCDLIDKMLIKETARYF